MKYKYLISLLIAIILFLDVNAQIPTINENIRKFIEIQTELGGSENVQHVVCKILTPQYYQERNFSATWSKTSARALFNAIGKAENEGLIASDYHYEFLKSISSDDGELNAETEVVLTDAFFLYASHLISGKVNARSLDPEWKAVTKEIDLKNLLDSAITQQKIGEILHSLTPKYKTYIRLKKALNNYRQLAYDGGWKTIPDGETLKLGMSDTRIATVRNRLSISGDLPSKDLSTTTFDEELEMAVKKFQKRHGLDQDGAIGKNTLEILNEPVEKRIEQVIINMERCRWLPQNLGFQYLLVNIANYDVEAINGGELDLQMNVVVGKPFRKTPIFSSQITYLVFNPYWTVPPTILEKDILPAVRKNPGYLAKLNIKVVKGFGVNEQIIDPYSINWQAMTAKTFPYTLRQDPGLNNALGVVKFIFPNEYNVYMHDTNHRELFSNTDRALSSGCIRLSKPLDLAYYLLKTQNGGYTKEKVDNIVATAKNQAVILQRPINVHLLYWTAFVDEDGDLNFRKDIYDRDGILLKAMKEKPVSKI